jgi:hypothetical protein
MRLGLGAALLGTAGLTACGEAGGARAPAVANSGSFELPEAADTSDAPLDAALLMPVEERAVLIASQVAAGAALARAGEADDAAEHLQLAISEVKPGGLTRLVENGLDPDLFDAASEALASDAPLEEVDAKLVAVEENVSFLRANAGGKASDLIALLIKRCQKAYEAGVSLNNRVEDPIQYQDAYGYAFVAQDLAAGLTSEDASALQLELKLLVLMWPASGPVSGDVPAPPMTFLSQVSRVEVALSAVQ